jgi:hypothetical protein
MSWIKENYHVAALGGGTLVLAGLGYLGYSGNQAVNETFNAPNPNPGKTTTAEGGDIATSVTKMVTEQDPVIHQKTSDDDGQSISSRVSTSTPRMETRRKLLDLLKIDPVHPPIGNQWWVDNRIDPSYSDSPTMDQDSDGFTNKEEFLAKTDPNDPDDYGVLVQKLEVVKVESDMWRLLFKTVLGKGYQFDYMYKPFGKRLMTNRIPASEVITEGDTFFSSDPGKDRFKLTNVEKRAFEGPAGQQMREWATIEDQNPSKNKQQFDLPFNAKKAELRDITFYDHRVTLRLNAIGEEGNEITLEESGSFALPANGADKIYKLAEVKLGADQKPESVIVEYNLGDGVKTVEIKVPAQ